MQSRGAKKNRLAGLDHIIETKAVELLTQNPFLTSNDDRVEKIRGFRFGNAGEIKTAPVPWFNIYPTYFETQRVFPRFLAICRGEDSLESAGFTWRATRLHRTRFGRLRFEVINGECQ